MIALMIARLLAALLADPCIPIAERTLDLGRWGTGYCELQDLYAAGHRHAAHGMGIALIGMNRAEEAVLCLYEVAPSESLGVALHSLGRCDEAAVVFGALLDEDPATIFNYAAALLDAGHPAQSMFYEVAARVAPDDGLAQVVVSVIETF